MRYFSGGWNYSYTHYIICIYSIRLNIEFSVLCCNGYIRTCFPYEALSPHSMWMIMVVKIVDSLTTLYFVASHHSLTSFPAFPCANERSCVSTICVKVLTIADGCTTYNVVGYYRTILSWKFLAKRNMYIVSPL